LLCHLGVFLIVYVVFCYLVMVLQQLGPTCCNTQRCRIWSSDIRSL